MLFDDSVLSKSEKITYALRSLFSSFGYLPCRLSKFEEYDLYASNKDFLISDNVITFTNTDGKLMAFKPDVTLSVIKNAKDEPNITKKVSYNEYVYRIPKGSSSFKEIMQVGTECFGLVGFQEVCENITLAQKSLDLLSSNNSLVLSDLDILEEIVSKIRFTTGNRKKLYQAIEEKNTHEIDEICVPSPSVELLKELLLIVGPISTVLSKLDDLLFNLNSYPELRSVLTTLDSKIAIDFSVLDDENYYNGIVFKGYIQSIPDSVLSGGQYNKLMKKIGRESEAIGFAVYLDTLERLEENAPQQEDDYLNIALPKGRLGEKVYSMFAKAGFDCPSILEQNRKLIFEDERTKVRYFWVKPSDVAIYVERGAADIGVAGKDILLEYTPDVYELLDLQIGKCRMCVAGPNNFVDDPTRTLHVATKFSKIATDYYQSIGRDIDIIHLNGSIEIAPILGLSDVIVDIVETGTTLKENNLGVLETIVPISARLISNKSSYKFKNKQIDTLVSGLSRLMEESKND